MYFCYNYNYYKKFTRHHIISKHNTLNFFEVGSLTTADIVFSLKNNRRECNLLLFWLIFILSGRKPLILKTFSGLKKNKIKFILRLQQRAFISLLRVFSIFVLAGHGKNILALKKEKSSFFFIFKGSYLECPDTLHFYNYINNLDLKFLLENLHLIFKFKVSHPGRLSTGLNCLQLPTTHDTKGNNSTN
jgi:hypothetical protein